MKEKMINLITYHRAYNYGAVLQTYASVVFLKKLGYDIKIIDYTPKYLQNFGTFKNTFNQVDNKKKNIIKRSLYALIKTPSYKKLKRVFNNFVNSTFELTKTYSSIEELKSDKPIAKYYCSGSDQIWNNYYTGSFDDAFFLNFLEDKDIRISFASSFGKDKFNEKEKRYIKESLSKYSLLTVREKAGKELLDELKIMPNNILYDPTLLVDFDFWYEFARGKDINEKYILVYQLHGDSDAFDNAMKFAKKKKMKVIRIITMYHQIRTGCKNIIVPKIPEFLNLFKNAEYVFTDSFHGTVFSIVYKKKLGVRLPVRFSNRITSLLESINSNYFIIKDLDNWEKNVTDQYAFKANEKMELSKNEMVNKFIEEFSNIKKEGNK